MHLSSDGYRIKGDFQLFIYGVKKIRYQNKQTASIVGTVCSNWVFQTVFQLFYSWPNTKSWNIFFKAALLDYFIS